MMNKSVNALLRWGMLLAVFSQTACGGGSGSVTGSEAEARSSSSTGPSASSTLAPTGSPWPAPTPATSPSAASDTGKADDSIRAIGDHPEGRLAVRPVSHATVAPLGAPSCYGLETDLGWTGAYEAVWQPKSGGTESNVLTFPADFSIVQRTEAPVAMRKFELEGADLFAYVPRYTDCHAQETYFFGVSGGIAFPITVDLGPDRKLAQIGQLPHRPFQIANGELILTGGYGAGQDLIEVYHFHFDLEKRALILQRTDKVKPSDIKYEEGVREG